MATDLLTTAKLRSVTEEHVGTILSDGGGLRGRVRRSRSGAITIQFEYKYRNGKKYRTAKVSHWPKCSLAGIRKLARDMKTNLSKGIDPIESRKAEQLESRLEQAKHAETQRQELERLAVEAATQRTLTTAIEYWEKMELSRRKDGGEEVMRSLRKDVLPVLGNVPLMDIRRAMLMDILDGVVERGALVMANHLFGDLRQFFNFAITREWIDAHPLAGLRKEHIGGAQKEGDRYLTEDEIVELNKCLPTAKLQRTTELSIWIMLSTCCRVGELIQTRWEDIDFELGTWHIPAGNSKNAKDHTIYLSTFAKEQFEELQTLTGSYDWCMPTYDGNNHVCLKSITKQIKDRVRETPLKKRSKATKSLLLTGGGWTPHDLRRTGATMMGDLGAMGEVIDRCLNHVQPNKLKRIYQRHELKREQREAWRLLGERLDLLKSADTTEKIIVVNI